jgi:hypothetical protein
MARFWNNHPSGNLKIETLESQIIKICGSNKTKGSKQIVKFFLFVVDDISHLSIVKFSKMEKCSNTLATERESTYPRTRVWFINERIYQQQKEGI